MNEFHKCKNDYKGMNTITDLDPQYQENKRRSLKKNIISATKSQNYLLSISGSDLLFRGKLYYELENYDSAIIDFERGLYLFEKEEGNFDCQIIETYLLLGLCHFNKKDIYKSSTLFNKIYDLEKKNNELESGYGYGYICKGVNYFSIGDIKKACEYFRKANKDGKIQEKIGGIICKIVQICKCDDIKIIDVDKERDRLWKLLGY